MQFDRSKSLQQLDGQNWGEPTYDSHLVTECHRLRRVPLCQFTVEDLRIMIGQDICLEFLMPLALEHLRDDPLAEGAYYSGDLLSAVLRAGKDVWQHHPDWRSEVAAIAQRTAQFFPGNEMIAESYEVFQRDLSTGHDQCAATHAQSVRKSRTAKPQKS
ncbi:MAG: hypothetical protein HZA88_00860 [Verrucomicrobia bacterium]|nr:hypothetical protein [Verrucomicrobiota bacterium]